MLYETKYAIIQYTYPMFIDNLCKFGDTMDKIFREIKSRILFQKSRRLNFPAHIHDDIELVFVEQGNGTAWCDGKSYNLTEGTWFLAFPNQAHRYKNFVQGCYYVLILKPTDLLRYQQVFRSGAPSCASQYFQDDDGMSSLLAIALREYKRDGFNDVIAAYLTALFGKLLPHFPVIKSGSNRDNVLKILEYCSAHYKEDISLESVAEQLNLSCSCVSHIFSDRISMRFSDYINSLRLSEAAEILKNPDYSVTDVAGLSGFPTIRTFNRAFQKHYGITPTTYRKRWLAK